MTKWSDSNSSEPDNKNNANANYKEKTSKSLSGEETTNRISSNKNKWSTIFIYLKKTIIWKIVRNASSPTVDNEIWAKGEIKINDRKVPKITRGKESQLWSKSDQ